MHIRQVMAHPLSHKDNTFLIYSTTFALDGQYNLKKLLIVMTCSIREYRFLFSVALYIVYELVYTSQSVLKCHTIKGGKCITQLNVLFQLFLAVLYNVFYRYIMQYNVGRPCTRKIKLLLSFFYSTDIFAHLNDSR